VLRRRGQMNFHVLFLWKPGRTLSPKPICVKPAYSFVPVASEGTLSYLDHKHTCIQNWTPASMQGLKRKQEIFNWCINHLNYNKLEELFFKIQSCIPKKTLYLLS
jgi:hypothetical protein